MTFLLLILRDYNYICKPYCKFIKKINNKKDENTGN